jgi:hypothetical protein
MGGQCDGHHHHRRWRAAVAAGGKMLEIIKRIKHLVPSMYAFK